MKCPGQRIPRWRQCPRKRRVERPSGRTRRAAQRRVVRLTQPENQRLWTWILIGGESTGLNGASIESRESAVQLTSRHHYWFPFTKPAVDRSPNLCHGAPCRGDRRTAGVVVRQKFEQVQGRSRVARVLGHECRESAGPALGGLGTGHRTPTMPLQLADDLAPG